jgi:HSP20 family protein
MPLLEKWTALRELDLLDRRMRRLFVDLHLAAPTPSANVYDTDSELVIEVEVPGFAEKELELEVRNHALLVSGMRGEVAGTRERRLRVHERLQARFERRFELPAEIDSDHVTAEYDKGVLTVRVPKTSHEQPRKVAITKA